MGLFAVDPSIALTFALVMHGVLFVPPLLIAMPVLAGERWIMDRATKVGRTVFRWVRFETPFSSKFLDRKSIGFGNVKDFANSSPVPGSC